MSSGGTECAACAACAGAGCGRAPEPAGTGAGERAGGANGPLCDVRMVPTGGGHGGPLAPSARGRTRDG